MIAHFSIVAEFGLIYEHGLVVLAQSLTIADAWWRVTFARITLLVKRIRGKACSIDLFIAAQHPVRH